MTLCFVNRDDNKILTLASNERIALTPEMRLIFEISNLRTATPATVSRAGILYINPGDLGWNPYVTSWIETREHQAEKANLTVLFDKYVPSLQVNVISVFCIGVRCGVDDLKEGGVNEMY